MRRKELIEQITDYLAYLKSKVEISNSLHLTDINRHAEDFYCGLLNLVYGYNLKNINIDEPNAASIDLGDPVKKIAIQVTSTKGFKKVRDTHSKFVKKKLFNTYDRLVILNIREKASHKTKKVGDDGGFQLDIDDDLWDVSDLATKIASMTDLEKMRDIVFYLDENLKIQQGEALANEVLTILNLIELLSEDADPAALKKYKDDPNPTDKVYRRFSDHAEFLTRSYTDLFGIYGRLLADIFERAAIPQPRLEKMQRHLQQYSDQVLTECGGDPRVAIKQLQDHYGKLLRGRGIAHDDQAVRFFLIDQLTRCNVFPAEDRGIVQPVS